MSLPEGFGLCKHNEYSWDCELCNRCDMDLVDRDDTGIHAHCDTHNVDSANLGGYKFLCEGFLEVLLSKDKDIKNLTADELLLQLRKEAGLI